MLARGSRGEHTVVHAEAEDQGDDYYIGWIERDAEDEHAGQENFQNQHRRKQDSCRFESASRVDEEKDVIAEERGDEEERELAPHHDAKLVLEERATRENVVDTAQCVPQACAQGLDWKAGRGLDVRRHRVAARARSHLSCDERCERCEHGVV